MRDFDTMSNCLPSSLLLVCSLFLSHRNARVVQCSIVHHRHVRSSRKLLRVYEHVCIIMRVYGLRVCGLRMCEHVCVCGSHACMNMCACGLPMYEHVWGSYACMNMCSHQFTNVRTCVQKLSPPRGHEKIEVSMYIKSDGQNRVSDLT